MVPYINLHTHRKPQVIGEIVIRNAFLKELNFDCLDYPVSLGLHPWFVHKTNLDWALNIIEQRNKEIIAIGECGIDRAIQTPFELQLIAFHAQIEIGVKYNLPVIVHCVKAYSDFAAVAKMYPQTSFVLHGFSGNNETLFQLLKFSNVFMSLGKHLFNPLSNAGSIITQIPLDRLFLETDTSKYAINQIYNIAVQRLEIEETVLKTQIFYNFEQIFKQYK